MSECIFFLEILEFHEEDEDEDDSTNYDFIAETNEDINNTLIEEINFELGSILTIFYKIK